MQTKTASTQVDVHDIIARRWSCRAFDASKPVSREQIIALLEAARWAPSCFGDEPWRFIVWDRNSDEAAWQKAFGCLGEWNQNWVKNAPVLLLSTAYSLFRKNGTPNRWGQHDTGAASENLCLQAVASGLMAHQMGGFDEEKTRLAFNIPKEFALMAMIAVGYQGEPEVLNDELKELELADRSRTLLGVHFFEGDWGVPVKG
ncbi:MAG: nitroreductase [Betaproteobacteria bacterium CG2_30_59_46]|nr:MAG: nitroreductase [Betaproteobacteria bacterium CG2_30_59_46]PIQ14015.1 MAG: nitroreductase [Hydrogenophilales bacterium CG18_big_fil_WC_8_21_14_2_50_58_12]PIX99956.1 MAG: nitroreductase [Hydrogenophilales bacterium CG_4_10_14_3_um_filter_58_23]PJB08319.1 MAG: nitroreductase [Hydrogenophilales bacterium CG_4_9_14_3_um_filter_59_35]